MTDLGFNNITVAAELLYKNGLAEIMQWVLVSQVSHFYFTFLLCLDELCAGQSTSSHRTHCSGWPNMPEQRGLLVPGPGGAAGEQRK